MTVGGKQDYRGDAGGAEKPEKSITVANVRRKKLVVSRSNILIFNGR